MSTSKQHSEQQVSMGEAALGEAVARNTPVEILRIDGPDDAPPGRGRLLDMNENGLVLEKVQVIGRDVAFSPGSLVECFFSHKNQLFQFRSEVTDTGVPFQLNEQFIVPGMTLKRPKEITPGQRRRIFRVSLSLQGEPPLVELWLYKTLERGFAEAKRQTEERLARIAAGVEGDPRKVPPVPRPTLLNGVDHVEPDLCGSLVEASDTGLGAVIDHCQYSRFKRFEQLAVRIKLPGDNQSVVFLSEVRHSREIREHTAKLGLMLLEDPGAAALYQRNRKKLVTFLQGAQRAQRG